MGCGALSTEPTEIPLFLLTQEFQNSAVLFGDESRKMIIETLAPGMTGICLLIQNTYTLCGWGW